MKSIQKVLSLLTNKEKKSAILVIIMVIIMTFLDTLGVASILPFISVLVNPEIIETNIVLAKIYKSSGYVGVRSLDHFIILLGILVFVLLIISLAFRAFTTYVLLSFGLMREYSVCKRLVEGYLHQPYSWFLNRNSANLGKNILSEVGEVITHTLIPMINILAQCLLTISLLLLLCFIDPILMMIIGVVLITSYLLIFILIKNKLSKLGSLRLKTNEERFTSLSEAFGAIKEVKIGNFEVSYIDRFSKPAQLYANTQASAQLISQLPRFFLEGIVFGGMIIITLFLIIAGGNFASIAPILSVYAFSGYRLMPALQTTYVAFTQLRFSKPALDNLYNDLNKLKNDTFKINQKKLIDIQKSITLNNVCFSYPNTDVLAIKNLNMEIKSFSKIGIVGLTGSGKTTIIDIILGLLEPKQGTLKIDGNIINSRNVSEWQNNIGYVPQQIYLSDASIAENIALGIKPHDINQKALELASNIANLHQFVKKELINGYNTIVGERGVRLSGGQRQRIGIARALYHNPQVLIFDEATSSLDNLTEKAVMEAIKNLANKKTIILIAHRLSTVKNCDNIFILNSGEIKGQGTYEQLIKSNPEFKKLSEVK
jgi:ABC-type multidrug transport system fused ATPase/permease subunit